MPAEEYFVQVAGVHIFRFVGGPIDEPKNSTVLFAQIGLAAASWARMEQHIDAILVQVNKEHHSDELLDLYDERHPGNFSDKIRLLESYFKKHPALERYKESVLDFTTGIKRLADDRHALMHGILEEHDIQKDTMVINRMMYRRKTKDFLNRHETMPIERLRAFTDLVNFAHYHLCEVSKELFTVDAAARLEMPPRPARHWWRRLWDRFFG